MSEAVEAQGYEPPTRLLRVLGVGFGLAVVIGGTIGSGIMRNPAVVARGLPDVRLVLLAWAIGGLLVAVDAMPTVELGGSIPRAGGPYALAERAFGSRVGFVVGWADWLQIAVSTGFMATAFGEYVQRLGLGASLPPGVLAVGLVVACGAVNWVGTRVGGASQSVGSAVKAAGLVLLVAALFLAPHAAGVAAPPPPTAMVTLAGAIAAMRAIYGAYGGWHAPVYFSEEVRQPERNVARTTFSGIALVSAIYLLVNAAVLHVLSVQATAASNLAVADAARVALGGWSERLVTALAVVSVATIANLQIMQHSRSTFAMARDRLLWPGLAAVAPGGAPRRSLALVVVVTAAIVIGATMAKGVVYETLLNLYAPFPAIVFLVLAVAAWRMRRREPQLARPWRMPLFPLPALLSAGLNAAMLVAFVWEDWRTGLWSALLLATAWPLLAVARRWRPAT